MPCLENSGDIMDFALDPFNKHRLVVCKSCRQWKVLLKFYNMYYNM